jgi:transcriptional regulator with XRE-family HTH domain
MDLRHYFAANIKRLRKECGLSQEGLAFESGLHRTYISGIERGIRNVGIDNIEVIAAALGVEPATLLARPKTR